MIQYLPTPTTKPGNEWCIRDEKSFLRDYAIHKDDLPLWHEVMVGQGRFWQIARLRYRIGPVFDLNEDAVDMLRTWSIPEISERMAQPPSVIEAELSQTWRYWTQQRAERKNETLFTADPIEPTPTPPLPSSPPPSSSPPSLNTSTEKLPSFATRKLDKDVADKILDELGINISDPQEKIYTATRALCYERWLNDSLTREFALNIMHMEIALRSYRRNVDKISKLLDKENMDAEKRASLMKEMRETEKAVTELAGKYHKALDEMGGEQSAVEDMKREAINTLGFVTQAFAKFRANGDTSLIDGVFTAREIVWLTTPVPMRPGQYRVDIVALINDAMKPENLFDSNYKPPHITREACRRLRRMSEIFEAEMGVVDNRNTVVEAPAEADAEEDKQVPQSHQINATLPTGDTTSPPAPALPFAFSHRIADESQTISFIPS
jgi:hypothetical protein